MNSHASRNDWREAYAEAVKRNAVVYSRATRQIAAPWDGRMPGAADRRRFYAK